MEFIKKIKKLFIKKEKQKEIKKINESEIIKTLDTINLESKKQLKEKQQEFYEKLFILLKELENATNILNNINIQEKKENQRIKSIVESGKNDYVKALKKLIENLKQKKDQDEFLKYINKEIIFFLKLEKKAKIKVTQLIGKEVENINNIINNIKKLINSFLDKNEELLKKESQINNIKKQYNTLKELNLKQKEIENNKKEIENQNDKLTQKTNNINNEIKKIQESQEYTKAKELQEKIKINKNKLFKLEMNIKGFFDNKLFIKYIHNEPDNTKINFIKNYINEPINQLEKDKELEINDYLKEIKQKHTKNILNLKESELKKLNESMNLIPISREKIIKIKQEINNLNKEINNLTKNNKIDLLKNEKNQNQEKLNENTAIINKINQKISNNKQEITQAKKELNENILKTCQVEIIN